MDDAKFVNNELSNNWYNGRHSLNWLEIRTERLTAIRAYAFAELALFRLTVLNLYVAKGMMHIDGAAFRGFCDLVSISLEAKAIHDLPVGVFDPLATTLCLFSFSVWPKNINLNAMFADGVYRMVKSLDIANVELPQLQFRVLAAANFSSFRRLQELHLINCGIEVIEVNTFDQLGVMLNNVALNGNWIKTISFGMFRQIFESNWPVQFEIRLNREQWICTCDLIEVAVMVCPFVTLSNPICIKCTLAETFLRDGGAAGCAIHFGVKTTKFCINYYDVHMHMIKIQLVYMAPHSIRYETQFNGAFRLILVNFDAMKIAKCTEKVTKSIYKCLKIYQQVGQLDLDAIETIGQAEFVLVTVIPILYRFGARPIHSMTVRQPTQLDTWIDELDLLLVAWLTCMISSLVGFVCVICLARLAAYYQRNEEMPSSFNEVVEYENEISYT